MENPNKPEYIPLECQIHTCHNEPIVYCNTMYVFVCEYHKKEFCDKEKHNLESIECGLQFCIDECQSTIKLSLSYIKNQGKELLRYRNLLKRIQDGKSQETR